jgi:hypothetical protein
MIITALLMEGTGIRSVPKFRWTGTKGRQLLPCHEYLRGS